MNSQKNQKLFPNFLSYFWNLHQMLNILKKRMIVIANVFPKLQTMKTLLRPLPKKRCYRTSFDNEHVKASTILAKSPEERFSHVFQSFSGKLIPKMFPLVLGEILGVCVKTLTADGKYFVQDCGNLPLAIQMHYRKNKNFFLYFLFHIWNLHGILNVLKKRVIAIANVFPKSQTLKNLVRPLSKKRCFWTRFESQQVKASRIIAKSQWEHFYQVFWSLSGTLV